MDDDRLDARARAALYDYGWPTFPKVEPTAPDQSADYKRGWNDAMDYMRRAMTRR